MMDKTYREEEIQVAMDEVYQKYPTLDQGTEKEIEHDIAVMRVAFNMLIDSLHGRLPDM